MIENEHSNSITASKGRKFLKRMKNSSTTHFTDETAQRKHQRNQNNTLEETLKSYVLSKDKTLPVFQFDNEYPLLSYKFYSKKQDIDRHKKRLAICVRDKYKIISADLRQRLYVNNFPDEVKSILDVDEDYYKLINSRPLKSECAPYKSFKMFLNSQLRLREEIGIVRDCVLNIKVNHRKELEIYDLSLRRLKEQATFLDEFVSEDYRKSKILLEEGNKLLFEVDKIKSELENLAAEKFSITSQLLGLDYKYSLQQKYGRFLYYLSPPLWRVEHRDFAKSVEIEAKGFDFGNSSEEDSFNVIYEKLLKECCGEFVKPALYFTEPNHLMEVFVTIEQQQLHNFTHVTHFSPYIKMLRESIISLKYVIAQESIGVASTIKYFESLLQFCEERSIFLKAKFFKILHELFYQSVGALDVLELSLNLEFCYEKVYQEKPANKDITAIAKALETFYMDYLKRLDALHSDRIRRAVSICLETERKKVRRAEVAANELRLFNRLERELLRAYGLLTLQTKTSPILPIQKHTQTKNVLKHR